MRLNRLRAVITHPGLQATLTFRYGQSVLQRTGVMRLLGMSTYAVLSRVSQVLTGIWISPKCDIGPGLYIAHFGGVIIGPCRIGANCNIGHGVTVGKSGRGSALGDPVIGDRVNLAPGSQVLGAVVIGNDVLVGANAVVVRSVPERGVAGGIPAKVISWEGAFGYVEYPGMDCDFGRIEALAEGASQSTASSPINGTSPSASSTTD